MAASIINCRGDNLEITGCHVDRLKIRKKRKQEAVD